MRFLAASRLCAMVTGLVAIGPMANAGAPMPVGKRAMLSLSIQIDGAGQHASKSDGVDVKWSAHRTFDAKVELAAEKASSTSVGDVKGQVAAAAHLSTDMQALQKQAKQCQPDDMACQMELAAKMMETDDAKKMVQQAQAAQGAPDRYQSWKAPAKAGQVQVRADSMDQWDGVFLTGSREERHCKISGVYPGGNAAAAAKNRETMEGGVKGLQVAVDTQTARPSVATKSNAATHRTREADGPRWKTNNPAQPARTRIATMPSRVVASAAAAAMPMAASATVLTAVLPRR